MEFIQAHQKRISFLELSIDRWSKHYPQAFEELRYWQRHHDIHKWMQSVFVKSLLNGDSGVEECILEMEHDPILARQSMKFLYAYKIWDELRANPNEIAYDLKEQGWCHETLGHLLCTKYINHIATLDEDHGTSPNYSGMSPH